MLRALLSAIRNPRQYRSPRYPVRVRCARCGEIITASVNLHHDLSLLDEKTPQGGAYRCRKVLTGSGRCFQRVHLELYFDQNRKLVSWEASGGEMVSHG